MFDCVYYDHVYRDMVFLSGESHLGSVLLLDNLLCQQPVLGRIIMDTSIL